MIGCSDTITKVVLEDTQLDVFKLLNEFLVQKSINETNTVKAEINMSGANKPICFIAMAFGYDDTDEYFEKLVLPVLKQNNITPIIINRHQSNDDLNLQIFEQLKKADFCIADLTYTRPSVYFEAGFAEREIPVIYTVRKDHLNRGQPDDKRVHFDLQMKPILTWSTPEDNLFPMRLEKRLTATVLRDWIKNRNITNKAAIEVEKFNHQSLGVRLFQIKKHAVEFLESIGLKNKSWVMPYQVKTKKKLLDLNFVRAVAQKKKEGFFVSLEAHDSITQLVLRSISNYHFDHIYSLSHFRKKDENILTINRLTVNHIVLSLKPIKSNSIEKIFDKFTPVIKTKAYTLSTSLDVNGQIINYSVNLFFVSNINSISQLDTELNNILAQPLKQQIKNINPL